MSSNCEQCGRRIVMMCQKGTYFCSQNCRRQHLDEWAEKMASR